MHAELVENILEALNPIQIAHCVIVDRNCVVGPILFEIRVHTQRGKVFRIVSEIDVVATRGVRLATIRVTTLFKRVKFVQAGAEQSRSGAASKSHTLLVFSLQVYDDLAVILDGALGICKFALEFFYFNFFVKASFFLMLQIVLNVAEVVLQIRQVEVLIQAVDVGSPELLLLHRRLGAWLIKGVLLGDRN